MGFQVGDRVMLKVSPWMGMIRFGNQGKLTRVILDLLKSLLGSVQWLINYRCHKNSVKCTTLSTSQILKRCLSDETLVIPLNEIEVRENLIFMEESVEIVNYKVKKTKLRPFPIIKVRWNAKRGPEYS